jgi:hypothetical protein
MRYNREDHSIELRGDLSYMEICKVAAAADRAGLCGKLRSFPIYLTGGGANIADTEAVSDLAFRRLKSRLINLRWDICLDAWHQVDDDTLVMFKMLLPAGIIQLEEDYVHAK